MGRIADSQKTVARMIRLTCRAHHRGQAGSDGLCPDCRALLDYARDRLDHCPFGDAKPVCARCRIHCYRPEQRGQIRQVMRYSGPRMIRAYPLDGVRHLLQLLKDRRKQS